MDIIESLQWRYATKKFDESTIISDEKIDRICNAFNLTATSYGLQPIKLLVVKNKDLQLKMQASAFNQIQVSTASHVLVLCIETNIDAAFIDHYFALMKTARPNDTENIDAYHKVLRNRFENQTEEELTEWATKQAYLSLGNLLTVCAIEKVDSCPMEGFIPKAINELLELDAKNLASVLLLPIGIRSKDDLSAMETKVRRPISEIFSG